MDYTRWRKHEIYKVLIYLQDHTNDNNGLTVIDKSHLIPEIYVNHTQKKTIHSKIGNIIIFDQRITHRGQQDNFGNIDRILISLGFGKIIFLLKNSNKERLKDKMIKIV